MQKKAVVLLSGGLDSATCLWWAISKGMSPTALIVDYGQRHCREIVSARSLVRAAGVRSCELKLNLPWLKVSSLVGRNKRLPDIPLSRIGKNGVPSTYVPARNTMLLSLAGSLAESIGARTLVIGANALDYSGYPDCRPAFTRAMERALGLGTRAGNEGRGISIVAPLIRLNKAAIVRLAFKLGVPLESTWSCYLGGKSPCGACDSCKLRAKGFKQADACDPLCGHD